MPKLKLPGILTLWFVLVATPFFFPRNLPGHACCFFEAQSTSEQKWLEVRAQNNYRNQNSVLLLMM